MQWLVLWLVLAALVGLYVALAGANAARSKAVQKATWLAIRADEQHAQVMDGDDDGLYGVFPPAEL